MIGWLVGWIYDRSHLTGSFIAKISHFKDIMSFLVTDNNLLKKTIDSSTYS